MKNEVRRREPEFLTIILIAASLLLIVAIIFTMHGASREISSYYDMQIEATKKAKTAMEAIKNKKIENSIPLVSDDIYESYMLGEKNTEFTTTTGDLKAKKTALNPNFAALFIKYFNELGLKAGDEVAISESGSFPALNICALSAIEVYGLKPFIMVTLGASSYGANDPSFTYFDIQEFLFNEGIINNRIDYVSFGGANDDGSEFSDEIKNPIISRIDESGIPLLTFDSFQENIDKRRELISENCPNLKLFINIGGNIISMGIDEASAVTYKGLILPRNRKIYKDIDPNKRGLIDLYLEDSIPVIQMLNIKGIANKEGIEYNPESIPQIGTGEMYYELKYHIEVPIISIVLIAVLVLIYAIYKKKYERGNL